MSLPPKHHSLVGRLCQALLPRKNSEFRGNEPHRPVCRYRTPRVDIRASASWEGENKQGYEKDKRAPVLLDDVKLAGWRQSKSVPIEAEGARTTATERRQQGKTAGGPCRRQGAHVRTDGLPARIEPGWQRPS